MLRWLPHLRVAYLMGTGDTVPQALANLGVRTTYSEFTGVGYWRPERI